MIKVMSEKISASVKIDIGVWRRFGSWVSATGQSKSKAIENALDNATPSEYRDRVEEVGK